MIKKTVACLFFLMLVSITKAGALFFEKISFPVDYEMKVTAIEQDDDGYMWVGTREGLYRYDGYEMERIFPLHGDSINWRKHQVISLLVEGEQLWFSLHNGDVMNYQMQSGDVTRIYPKAGETKYQYGRAISLVRDSQSQLWIGLTKGLMKITKNQEVVPIGDYSKVFSLWFNHEKQQTWVLHDDKKISVINQNDSIIREYDFVLQKAVRQFRSGCIQKDQAGVIWASVGNNVYQYLPDTDNFKKVTSVQNEIIDFAFGRNNRLWLNDAFKELAYYDQKTGKLEHIKSRPEQKGSLGSNNIFSLHMNRSGVLFIGTLNGLYKLDWTKQFFYHLPIGGGVDYALFSKGAQLGLVLNNFFYWLEQNEQGAILMKARVASDVQNGLKKPVTIPISIPKDISILKRASDRSLWAVSASEGLMWIDLKNNKAHRVELRLGHDIHINGVSNGKNNELWLSANEGIYRILYKKFPYRIEEVEKVEANDGKRLQNSTFTALHYDKEGMLWVNARGYGIFRYNPSTFQWQKFELGNTNANIAAFTRITSINETSGGTIWLGSTDSGVAFFDKVKNDFVKISSSNGLMEDEVCAIVFESENVTWISHVKGLTRIEIPEFKFDHYTHENGLLSGQFIQNAGLKSENGIIFFANTHGWVYFNPSMMILNQVPPHTVLKKFRVNGVEKVTDLKRLNTFDYELELTGKYKKLEMYVRPMSYTSSHQNKIAWRIGEEDWQQVSTDTPWLSLPELKTGDYELEIRASNNDGIWSDETIIVDLSVRSSLSSRLLKLLLPLLVLVFLVIAYILSGRVIISKRRKKVDEDKLSIADKQRIDELRKLMEKEEVYLNPELSLKDLASQLNCSANTLSSVFNDLLNQNFYDYVNNYRVEHVKAMLNNKDMAHYTLLSIGFDSGFNSKSSFYRIFKKHTGLTPSEYQKQVLSEG
ncbi:ligand-binding sensor domain-containing protein [Carboxylicivirga marina]|uniref:Helix-turn-helix domain-containing protein n=1 Tax=Carboxylicivirga marina TaxID=2800988 RepID=A0ABS1HIL9_9BACT|nr:helix-turn-helix domain-containing protein [Carboxylicivirga marina]MBK3517518.1 helix-turn-helix domain-containing protein [Carboxylicivirga marina]